MGTNFDRAIFIGSLAPIRGMAVADYARNFGQRAFPLGVCQIVDTGTHRDTVVTFLTVTEHPVKTGMDLPEIQFSLVRHGKRSLGVGTQRRVAERNAIASIPYGSRWTVSSPVARQFPL